MVLIMSENESRFWDKIQKIRGLSTKRGLDIVASQLSVYKNTLEISVREINKSINNLNRYLRTGDMKNFSIEAHGIKGSLNLIGANQLAVKASKLEQAGKNGDVGFVKNNLPEFLDGLGKLNSELKEAFAELHKNQRKVNLPPELPPILTKINKAMVNTDIDVLYAELDKLDKIKLEGSLKVEIENLKEAAFIMNQGQVAAIVGRLLGK